MERLHSRLELVISRLPENDQDEARESTNRVLECGIRSFVDLLTLIEDANHELEVRITACWIVGQLGNKRGARALKNVLTDTSPRLRAQAAVSLGRLRVKNGFRELVHVLQYDKELMVRMCAAHALGEIGNHRSISVLVNCAQKRTENPKLRGEAAEALTHFPESRDKTIPLLVKLLHDDEPEARFWAVYALGELGDEGVIPELERIAATDHAEIPGWWAINKEATEAIKSIRSRDD